MHHCSQNPWLHTYAVLVAGATFLLILAGALVTSNDAGLAVPDWPLSYGGLAPPMVGGIFYEHGHRLVASTVGLMTIGLAVWLSRREPRRWVRRLGWAALAAVVVQGILGGITVLYYLPPPVSIAHASLAQFFFCCTVGLAVFTSPSWTNRGGAAAPPATGSEAAGSAKTLFALAVATAVAVYGQLILGAAVRHAVLGIWPHVFGAAVVAALGFAIVSRVFRLRDSDPHLLRRPAARVAVLVLVQMGLGLGSYLVKYAREPVQPLPLDVSITSAHVACGALLLAASLVLALRVHRLCGQVKETEQDQLLTLSSQQLTGNVA